MRNQWSNQHDLIRASLVALFLLALLLSQSFQGIRPNYLPSVRGEDTSDSATIAPSTYWGPFSGTTGDVQININRPGIAARVEIPREFLQGVVSVENDTHFVQTDIRNDYYYINVVDESGHWTYAWRGAPSDGPCFKPDFSLRDSNAPWCVEIWDYLNGTFLPPWSPPKFIRFHGLSAPSVAGVYTFTLRVATELNTIGYPDFYGPSAWNENLTVPISLSDEPASVTGGICDADALPPCPVILHDKGVVFAKNVNTQQVARAFVNETTGQFNVTGLAPGSYVIQASAGLVNGIAYSLSAPQPTPIQLSNGDNLFIGDIQLHRAPQVCGQLTYQFSPGATVPHAFSSHPYLKTILGSGPALKLNITVEATDSNGHTYRYQGTSLDSDIDPFKITTGMNTKFVGTDPYGTEYAGLPSASSGSYQLNLTAWITGYVQSYSDSATISNDPGSSLPIECKEAFPDNITMRVAGIISGTIQLQNLVTLETPNEAKASLGITTSDILFGGNILIEAYDQSGILRGVEVNGTSTLFGDVDSIRFYVIGFSEYANHTWSGVWDQKDDGLPAGPGGEDYTLKVYIRGYDQVATSVVTVFQGQNSTITIPMIRGGLFQVFVTSYDNRFGTRVIQAAEPWRFLNLPIPVRVRVYFYDSSGFITGYVERLMETGVVNGVDTESFSVLFTGQNWSIREIWFYGDVPTRVTNDTYSIEAFTLGYVQLGPVNTPNEDASSGIGLVALLIANDIDVTAPIFNDPETLFTTQEHEHAIGEAFGGTGLAGALPANLSANVPTLSLPVSGFGAMTIIACSTPLICKISFLGQGHFFYVSPDGGRHYDYGLDTGNYTAQIPEFGFSFHLMHLLPPQPIFFSDLSQEYGPVLSLLTMGRIRVSQPIQNSVVMGWVSRVSNATLSWVQVQASNGTYSRSVPTLDGQYDGPGALFLPEGTYDITFSVSFYKSETWPGVSVLWGGTYSILPPQGALCPTNGIAGVCDPPTGLYFQFQNLVPISGVCLSDCISQQEAVDILIRRIAV